MRNGVKNINQGDDKVKSVAIDANGRVANSIHRSTVDRRREVRYGNYSIVVFLVCFKCNSKKENSQTRFLPVPAPMSHSRHWSR